MDSHTHLPNQSNGVHVLLVDYNPTSLSKSALVLRKSSFKVTPTKIQQVALTLLQEFKGEYNLVITSDQNQEKDCHLFIQRIRSIEKDIPIIVISSLENNTDPGLKTLFDSACYVVNKPVTESTLWGVWQQHQTRTRLPERRLVNSRNKDQLVIEENRTLKRSSVQYENEEEIARKKGKSIAEPSNVASDSQHQKLLMDAIAYGGPTKHMNMTQYIPTMRQDFVNNQIKQAFHGTPRAPWTQHLYSRFVEAISYNKIPGYGVQQVHPLQMMYQRVPPSWMSPIDWRAQLSSEFLNSSSDLNMGSNQLFGLSDQYKASTFMNGGLNLGQTMNQIGTQSNPIILDEVSNNGDQADEMIFGSFGRDDSLLSVVYPKVDDSRNEPQMSANNANIAHVVTDQGIGNSATNPVELSANEAKIDVSSDFDEFAEFFAYLENDTEEAGTSSGTDKADEVEGDGYFDIDSFDFS